MQIIEPSFPPEVKAGLDELDALFNTNAVLSALESMLSEATSSPLAKRFSAERLAGESMGGLSANTSPALRGATEEAYKRGQLQSNITNLRSEFLNLFARAQTVYLDLEASKRDF